jgi:hypothetical protein
MAQFTLRTEGGSKGMHYHLSSLQTRRMLDAIEAGQQFITLNIAEHSSGVFPRVINLDDIASISYPKIQEFTAEVLTEFVGDTIHAFVPPLRFAGTLRAFHGHFAMQDRDWTCRLLDLNALNNIVAEADVRKEAPCRLIHEGSGAPVDPLVVRTASSGLESGLIAADVLNRHRHPALDYPMIVVVSNLSVRRAVFAELALALIDAARDGSEEVVIAEEPRYLGRYNIETRYIDELIATNPVLGHGPLQPPAGVTFKTQHPTALVMVEDYNDFKVAMPPLPGVRVIIVANAWKHVDGWSICRDGVWG